MTTLAHGLGPLENLAVDGRGGLLLSQNNLVVPGSLNRLDSDGRVSTVLTGVDRRRDRGAGPGCVLRHGRLDVGGAAGRAHRHRRRRRPRHRWAMDGGERVGRAERARRVAERGPGGERANGFDVGFGVRFGAALRTGRSGAERTRVGPERSVAVRGHQLRPSAVGVSRRRHRPGLAPQRWTIPDAGLLPVPDDLAVDADGRVYIALNLAGRVVRVDTATGQTCTIATGLATPTSVRFSGDHDVLFVSGFDGAVRGLRRS